MVKQLGRQSVNIDAMTPKDLDQLSDIIAEALQVVDGVGGKNNQQRGREVTADEGAADEGESKGEGESEAKRDPELEPSLGAERSDSLEEAAPQGTQKNNTGYAFIAMCLNASARTISFWIVLKKFSIVFFFSFLSLLFNE